MTRRDLVLIFLVFTAVSVAGAQTTVTNSGEAKAQCAVANTGVMSNVSVTCTGVPAKDAPKLADMLNALLRNQNNLDATVEATFKVVNQMNANFETTTYGNLRDQTITLAQKVMEFIAWRDSPGANPLKDPTQVKNATQDQKIEWRKSMGGPHKANILRRVLVAGIGHQKPIRTAQSSKFRSRANRFYNQPAQHAALHDTTNARTTPSTG